MTRIMPTQISRILSRNNNFRSSLCKSLPAAATTSRGLVGGLIQHKQRLQLEPKHRKFAAVAKKRHTKTKPASGRRDIASFLGSIVIIST
mmetsp:Transcript_28134/g.33329  ORF Transcript_28134/g.33329 Transcript_28134/m.33329 type:complete len:90 (-) Transcript_28134:123-392(-)